MSNQVVFAPIVPCDKMYGFGMTYSGLQCFLKVASCIYGDLASKLFDKNSMGIRDKCCEQELFMLHKQIETLACWKPQSKVELEYPAYFVFKFLTYTRESDVVVGIRVLGHLITYTFDDGLSLLQNLDNFVAVINQDATFKAQMEGDLLFLYAPSGYQHVPAVFVTSFSDQITWEYITTAGFQGGCIPKGSYVDFTGEYHEGPADCLTEAQVGRIIDNIKKYVNCGCLATPEILNDEVD